LLIRIEESEVQTRPIHVRVDEKAARNLLLRKCIHQDNCHDRFNLAFITPLSEMNISEFVNELKKEHAEIRESLNKIDQIGHFTKEARVELMFVKDYFLRHLEKEDGEVYPRLKEASLQDENLKNIFQYFEDEEKLISKFALIFFDKYSSRDAISDGFQREFNLIYSTLMKRIEKEEEILFPEYEKL
jgi:iron-sulfur cluster repair protein YtfE (RIC family)